jgi:tetratricopeptide (TPR) repeat protein
LTESLITSAAKRSEPIESNPAGAATSSPTTGASEPAGQDQFGKILTETDVYLKYGLFDRALEHLGKIFAVDPENLEAHEKAYQVYAASDSRTQASEQQLNVLRLCTRFGQVERGRPYLEALMRENPEHPELPVFQSVLGGGGEPQSAGIEVLSDAEILIESEDTDPQGHWPSLPEEEAIEDLALGSVESAQEVEVVADEGEEEPTPTWDEPLLQAPELPVDLLSDQPPAAESQALDQAAEEIVEEESLALGQNVEESLEEVPLEDRTEDPPAAEELAEATFFIEQGLVEEAREILETIVIAYPGHAEAEALLGSLGEADQAEIDSLAQEVGTADFQYSVEDVFAEFKKGLEKVVTPEDVETHYDLGIAYKEMGLLDDAINEFSVARQGCLHQKKEIDCLTMIGLLQLAKGEPAAAVRSFQEALSSEHATAEMQKALEYELAIAWENAGSAGKALYRYQRVSKLDPGYRDVAQKISQLSAQAQPEEDAAGNGALGVEEARSPKDSGEPDSESGAPNRSSAGGRRKVGYM